MSSTLKEHSVARIEAILAREIITLASEYRNNASVLESISEICFTLDRLFQEIGSDKMSEVDWKTLFDEYDKRYYALAQGNEPPVIGERIEAIVAKINHMISAGQLSDKL